jgi:hypothetical protein
MKIAAPGSILPGVGRRVEEMNRSVSTLAFALFVFLSAMTAPARFTTNKISARH